MYWDEQWEMRSQLCCAGLAGELISVIGKSIIGLDKKRLNLTWDHFVKSMYKYILIILIFPFLNVTAFAQTLESEFPYKFVYKTTYFPDSLNHNKKEVEYMELLVNDSISVFQSLKKGLRDSLVREHQKGDKYFDPFKDADNELLDTTSFRIKHMIIARDDHLFVSDSYRFLSLLGDPDVRYYEEKTDFDWAIQEETKEINGLSTQKATVDFSGRSWVAWFSPDIPISKGPYKFGGLPGLIIRMYDTKDAWRFELTESSKTCRSIKLPDRNQLKKAVITKSKFFEERMNYKKNRTFIDEAAKSIIIIGEEARKRAREFDRKWLKENNNWIELQ